MQTDSAGIDTERNMRACTLTHTHHTTPQQNTQHKTLQQNTQYNRTHAHTQYNRMHTHAHTHALTHSLAHSADREKYSSKKEVWK